MSDLRYWVSERSLVEWHAMIQWAMGHDGLRPVPKILDAMESDGYGEEAAKLRSMEGIAAEIRRQDAEQGARSHGRSVATQDEPQA